MQPVRQVDSRQVVLGLGLAMLWGFGLFWVLEVEALLSKVIVLAALAPMSLALDRLISGIKRGLDMGGRSCPSITNMPVSPTRDKRTMVY